MTVQAPQPGGLPQQAGASASTLAAGASQAQTVAQSGSGTAVAPQNTGHLTEPNTPSSYSQRTVANKGVGVGGLPVFALSERNVRGGNPNKKFVFDMAPARKSFMGNQGQAIPGAYAGMPISMVFNLAKLPLPGAQPSFQGMGIAYEVIDIVGAFVGGDHPFAVLDTGARADARTAADAAEALFRFKQTGREVVLHLGWRSGGQTHDIEFDNNLKYTGRIRKIERSFAHENRVYFSFRLEVTNREDTSAGTKKIKDAPFTGWAPAQQAINAQSTSQFVPGTELSAADGPDFSAIQGVDPARRDQLQTAYQNLASAPLSTENFNQQLSDSSLLLDPVTRRTAGFTVAENNALEQDGNFSLARQYAANRAVELNRMQGDAPEGQRPR